MELLQNVKRNIRNIPGWRTNRKIVVIESDDWGSIRMPSREVYESLLKSGIRVDLCPYNRFDALESQEDLASLFEVLIKFKDKNGNNPVFTANYIVANPDFDRIRASDFQRYYYELFTETYKRYPSHRNSFEILKQGINNKLFQPQFHGREHLNVNRWMKGLQAGFEETHLAFDNGLFGISTTITKEKRRSYLAALEFDYISELEWQKKILGEGLELFEQIFGYKSSSFIAPNYIWHFDLEPFLSLNGIKYIQGAANQNVPDGSGIKIKKHNFGTRNRSGQIYLNRNCSFEPTLAIKNTWVNSVLRDIEIAFRWHKPAVISSHRVNYIGSIVESNRKQNLLLLSELLKRIIERWPDVEFSNTYDLGSLIQNNTKI